MFLSVADIFKNGVVSVYRFVISSIDGDFKSLGDKERVVEVLSDLDISRDDRLRCLDILRITGYFLRR